MRVSLGLACGGGGSASVQRGWGWGKRGGGGGRGGAELWVGLGSSVSALWEVGGGSGKVGGRVGWHNNP